MITEAKILLSRRHAAQAMDISLRKLDLLIATGHLRAVQIGRRRLVPRKAIEELVETSGEREHLRETVAETVIA